MNAFFCVGTASMIAVMSMLCRESAAQYPEADQSRQGDAQPAAANSPSAQSAIAITKQQAAKIEANLVRLSPEDRQLVEAQVFCPITLRNRLGLMGPPVKVMIKNQPVFLCCKGCQAKALANPDATLARLAQLKKMVAEAEINASLAKLSPEDRRLAAAQGYCPVMTKNRLGVMGTPVKLMIGNEPVFLCCAGCKRRALANPNQTLAMVADSKAKVAQAAQRKATVETNPATR